MSGTLSSTLNAPGIRLAATKSPANLVVGTGLKVRINGTIGDDALVSYGGGSSLYGGLGDDSYYVWDPTDNVVESAGEGIDTVYSFGWYYTLPANVENLVLSGDGVYGFGNFLDNIIMGDVGTQLIDGGGGNDVLFGGPGADSFIFSRGSGQDVIADFEIGIDHVSLDGSFSQFSNFTVVRAAMTQAGSDVVLNFGSGDAITFRNHLIADFTASDFVLPPNFGALRATFDDEFNTFASSANGRNAVTGKPVWQSQYEFWDGWGMRTLAPGNPEVEYYSDPSVGVNPFTSNAGNLYITAAPAAAGTVPTELTYTSGIITTHTSFNQLYGYFEIRAQLPSGQGYWPSFWLLRTDGYWPPELDAMEASSGSPNQLLTTAITQQSGTVTEATAGLYVPDMSAGFHTYGVSWRPDMIRFYFDQREVFSTPTPADMHSSMYMVANLAVGADTPWPGPADGHSSGTLAIDYIRAYQYLDLPPVVPTVGSMKVLVGDSAANTLIGGAGDDRIEGGGGNDTLTGGAGADTFVFADLTGTDTITDFQPTIDKIVIQGFTNAQITMQALQLGMQLNFGTNHVMIKGAWWFAPGDIVGGATSTSGTTGADVLDRSAVVSSTASIYGLAGNDTIKGGSGDDWISGGPGNDTLTGGAGKNTFQFASGSGQDTISDFVPGMDKLVLQGIAQSSLSVAWATVGGVSGLRLNYGSAGDSIFLNGVSNLPNGSLILA